MLTPPLIKSSSKANVNSIPRFSHDVDKKYATAVTDVSLVRIIENETDLVGTYTVSSGQVESTDTEIIIHERSPYIAKGTYLWTIRAIGYKDTTVSVKITEPSLVMPAISFYEDFDLGWKIDLIDQSKIKEWRDWSDTLAGIFVSYNQEERKIINFSINEELGRIVIPKEELPNKPFILNLVADGYVTAVLFAN